MTGKCLGPRPSRDSRTRCPNPSEREIFGCCCKTIREARRSTLVYCACAYDAIKCRERTQRVATSGSRTSVRAGTPRSCATKPRPHATSKAKNGRGCFLPFFRFQHLAGFIFAEKSVQCVTPVKHLHWESWRSCQTAQQRHSSPFCSSTSDLGRQSTVTSGLPTTGTAAAISRHTQHCEPLSPLRGSGDWCPHPERGVLLEQGQGEVQENERGTRRYAVFVS